MTDHLIYNGSDGTQVWEHLVTGPRTAGVKPTYIIRDSGAIDCGVAQRGRVSTTGDGLAKLRNALNRMSLPGDGITVFAVVINYNNQHTYSEGNEATVHADRDDAVAYIHNTASRLKLDPYDTSGGDPKTDPSGQFFTEYVGHLNWRITKTTIR